MNKFESCFGTNTYIFMYLCTRILHECIQKGKRIIHILYVSDVLCMCLMKQAELIMYCIIIPCFIWLVKIAD